MQLTRLEGEQSVRQRDYGARTRILRQPCRYGDLIAQEGASLQGVEEVGRMSRCRLERPKLGLGLSAWDPPRPGTVEEAVRCCPGIFELQLAIVTPGPDVKAATVAMQGRAVDV